MSRNGKGCKTVFFLNDFDSGLPSVVASGRLEVDEAFLEADTFGAFEEFDVLVEVTVSDLGEVNIDLEEAEGGDEAEPKLAS